ncbi:long chain acyl-CoA synthetase [Trifolium repens]|nr:long chain acyl-CoA synthetase [Trifolium repens]
MKKLHVDIYPNNPMLGNREIVDGKLGKYKWLTYKEVYDMVIKVGNSIRSCGYGERGIRFVTPFEPSFKVPNCSL